MTLEKGMKILYKTKDGVIAVELIRPDTKYEKKEFWWVRRLQPGDQSPITIIDLETDKEYELYTGGG